MATTISETLRLCIRAPEVAKLWGILGLFSALLGVVFPTLFKTLTTDNEFDTKKFIYQLGCFDICICIFLVIIHMIILYYFPRARNSKWVLNANPDPLVLSVGATSCMFYSLVISDPCLVRTIMCNEIERSYYGLIASLCLAFDVFCMFIVILPKGNRGMFECTVGAVIGKAVALIYTLKAPFKCFGLYNSFVVVLIGWKKVHSWIHKDVEGDDGRRVAIVKRDIRGITVVQCPRL